MTDGLATGASTDPPQLNAVVVAYDSRPESLHALEVGRGLASSLRLPVVVVHAVDLADYPIDPDSIDWEAEGDRVLEDERLAAYEVMSGYEHDWRYEQRRGDPVTTLLEVAGSSGARLLVIGSRPRRPRHHRHGHLDLHRERHAHPVAQRLIEQSRIPVLVVGYDP